MPLKHKQLIAGIFTILIFANILAWIAVYDFGKPRMLRVDFFDVGQGDAIFIETPDYHQVLIDGGPDSSVLEKLGGEVPFWDMTIDLVILTHPEKDHMAGLIDVLKRYRVENVLWTGIIKDSAEYKEFKKALDKEGADVFVAESGLKITAGGVVFDVFYPFESLEGKEYENSNDTSVVLRAAFGGNSFLFTGDIENKAEEKIVENGGIIKSDIVKIPHHGSKTSGSRDFIGRVSPKIAVISAGRGNSYGHPHKEVLEILNKYGIKILRTDLNSDIQIFSDGKTFEIKAKNL